MHQKAEARRRRGMSRADVGLGGGVWGIWSGMETVRAPGQKYEVKYVQLKQQPRLRYTTSPCLKKGCAVPRNMSNNQGSTR